MSRDALRRLLVLAPGAVFFVILLPLGLVMVAAWLDGLLGLPRLSCGIVNLLPGWLTIALGWMLAAWTVYVQFTIGRGTPVPLPATSTRRLIVCPPYSYCRNPMALGIVTMYLGVAVLIGSLSAAFLVILGLGVLTIYIRLVEEKELAARFGNEYLEYKRRTPFLLPRFSRAPQRD